MGTKLEPQQNCPCEQPINHRSIAEAASIRYRTLGSRMGTKSVLFAQQQFPTGQKWQNLESFQCWSGFYYRFMASVSHLYLSVLFLDRYIPFGGSLGGCRSLSHMSRGRVQRGILPLLSPKCSSLPINEDSLFNAVWGLAIIHLDAPEYWGSYKNMEKYCRVLSCMAAWCASVCYDSDDNGHIVNIEVFVVQ